MKKRELVQRYVADNPDKTYRQIAWAVGLASPSSVHFHLKSQTLAQRVLRLEQRIEALEAKGKRK